jgi:hypothetical protein
MDHSHHDNQEADVKIKQHEPEHKHLRHDHNSSMAHAGH